MDRVPYPQGCIVRVQLLLDGLEVESLRNLGAVSRVIHNIKEDDIKRRYKLEFSHVEIVGRRNTYNGTVTAFLGTLMEDKQIAEYPTSLSVNNLGFEN